MQVATPAPDDVIHETLAGDDETPAVPGYDPDISAELYTTNGETTEHMQAAYGILGFTPEMSTCQTVSAADPDDEWEPAACASVFNFPDDQELVQEWQGGERYGDANDRYYAEFRADVSGAGAGDEVEVWFTGVKPGAEPVDSDRFTYTLERDTGAQVLVIANEDYTGVNPDHPASVTAPRYDEAHVAAVEAAGHDADLWTPTPRASPRPRRAVQLRRPWSGTRVTQDHTGSRRSPYPDPVRGASRRVGRRGAAVPHDGGPRLPQRWWQAAAGRGDGAVRGRPER